MRIFRAKATQDLKKGIKNSFGYKNIFNFICVLLYVGLMVLYSIVFSVLHAGLSISCWATEIVMTNLCLHSLDSSPRRATPSTFAFHKTTHGLMPLWYSLYEGLRFS